MTDLIIRSDMHKLDNKKLQDLGFMLIIGVWSKEVEMPQNRSEIEKLQTLKIPNKEILCLCKKMQ
jgi:hypothetical protein